MTLRVSNETPRVSASSYSGFGPVRWPLVVSRE